jgi:hypothetical protein
MIGNLFRIAKKPCPFWIRLFLFNGSRLGEGGDFHHKCSYEAQTSIYEKLSYEALNRHFCQTDVIGCPAVRSEFVCPKFR